MSEINLSKTEGVRELGKVDISDIRDAVLQLADSAWDKEEDFKANVNKHKAGPLKSTKHIMFTFSVKSEKGDFDYFELPIWKEWKHKLLPLMNTATDHFGYQKGFYPRVMLANLPAGQFIAPHKDGKAWAVMPHKIHVPLQTNEKSFFFLGKERCHFEEGMAYEVNNGLPHSVVNGGETDRIHLIFEYLDWNAQHTEAQQRMNAVNHE